METELSSSDNNYNARLVEVIKKQWAQNYPMGLYSDPESAVTIMGNRLKTLNTKQSHVLVSDDDAHWYVIPTDHQISWDIWLHSYDAEIGKLPSWAIPVNGSPTLVKFKEFTVR